MLIVVNKELFDIDEFEGAAVGEEYNYRTNYSVSSKVIKREKDRKSGEIKERPYNRPILDMYYDDYEYFQNGVSMTFVQGNSKGSSMLPLKCYVDGLAKYDQEVFLIAIPFNGTLDTIPKSYDYRILGGTIVNSQYKNITIENDKTKYKKILYLAVSPDSRKLYDENHAYHKDSIDIDVCWHDEDDEEAQVITYNTTISIFVDGNTENLAYRISNKMTYDAGTIEKNKSKSPVFEVYKPKKKSKK